MSANHARENFIPLRKDELVNVLCGDPGVPAAEREPFRACCRLIDAIYHHEYGERLAKLQAEYAPFDPDADTRSLHESSRADRDQRMYALFREFGTVLEEAGYKHLSAEDLAPACDGASAWGLRMDVDFRVFERLAIFVRGNTVQNRPLRVWRKGYRVEEREVPIYQRIVMLLKLRPHKRLGPQVDTERVYLQLFKNIPQLDVNMLLPGARVRMNYFDRGRVGLPLLSGLALTIWQVMQDIVGSVLHFINEFILFKPWAIWAAASGAFGYGFKSYYGYYQTRQRYVVTLMQVLYFQNLDTNAGVMQRLLNEAHEQDCREAVLAYFCLWRHGGESGWTQHDLDRFVEQDLQRRLNLQIDFDIGCLGKLVRLGIVEPAGDRFRARPLHQALAVLEEKWRGYFSSVNHALPFVVAPLRPHNLTRPLSGHSVE